MSHLLTSLRRLGISTLHVLIPPTCAVCGRLVGEDCRICPACRETMEPVRLADPADNGLTRLFAPCGDVVRATSLLRYHPETLVAKLLMELKYHGRPQLACHLGQWMARELQPKGFFADVDALIPMPLTPRRQKERGYNQSEQLARGISAVTGLPVRTDVVQRTSFRISQTRLSAEERRNNVEGAFSPTAAYRQAVMRGEGLHHPLFIDDVITTGASMTALISAVAPAKFSVLSLALAGMHPLTAISEEEIGRETSSAVTRTTVLFEE